ncbi:MAG TPA: DUF885 domain-containing protein [Xanthomonadales bacterium]|nr:DUF885 domain-containing protein [Xanthomonadales bacterium]
MRSSLLLFLALAAPAVAAPADEFRALWEREWAWRLEQYPMLATSVGEHRYDDRLGAVDEKSQQRRLAYYRDVQRSLRAIDPASLPEAQRVDYAIYADQVDSAVANLELHSYRLSINSDSPFYGELSFMPRQMPFADARDYRRYLARLADIPRWFDEHTAQLREGLKTGMTPPRVVLADRDGELRTQSAVKDPERSAFYAPFAEMPATIPASEAEALRREARDTIANAVVPAYAKLLRFYDDEYVPGARETLAAEKLPDGERFYRRQIRDYVTLDLDPEQVHATGLAEVARIRAAEEAIVAEVQFDGDFAAFLAFLRSDPQFYAKTPDELLMRAAWIAKRVDGQLPKLFNRLPRQPFGIAPVPDAIAPYYTAGRYVPAPAGSDEPGYYWVNTHDLPSRTLYTLPALTMHEAVPGHHLQGALANEQDDQPPFRRYSYLSAYGEGWALYAESLGDEIGIYTTPYERFGRLTYEMWRACRLVVDTGVHAKGWTRERAIAFLRDNTALSLHEIETEVDRYISWPGQALSYKLGELEIRALRREAEAALGAKFDRRAFHDTVLALGSVPLGVLRTHVRAWIGRQGAADGTGNRSRVPGAPAL